MSRMMLPDEVGPTPLTEGEIRAWRHGRAHGERAGIEMAAKNEQKLRDIIEACAIVIANGGYPGTAAQVRQEAAAIRSLIVG